MTKNEAILQMQNGHRVKHYLFSEDEFIYMKDGSIYDESGYLMESKDAHGNDINFWTDRTDEQWLDGWILLPDLLLDSKIYNDKVFEIKNYRCEYDYTPAYTVRYPNEKFISKNSHKRTNKRKKR